MSARLLGSKRLESSRQRTESCSVCCHDLGLNFSDRVGTQSEVLLIGRYGYRPELTSRVELSPVSLPALAFSLLFRFQGANMGTHPWVAVPDPPEFRLHAAGFWGRVATLSAVLTNRQPAPTEFSIGGGSPERLREVIRGVRVSQPFLRSGGTIFEGCENLSRGRPGGTWSCRDGRANNARVVVRCRRVWCRDRPMRR